MVSIFSVPLLCLNGQSRVFCPMARDKIIPESLGKINPHSPSTGVLVSAIIVTPLAAVIPSHRLWSMVSLGTLVTFIAVAIALIVLRCRFKRQPTGYRTPFYPLVPILSIPSCVYLLVNLSATVCPLFAVWLLFVGVC